MGLAAQAAMSSTSSSSVLCVSVLAAPASQRVAIDFWLM